MKQLNEKLSSRFEGAIKNYGIAVLTVYIAAVLTKVINPLIKDDSFEIFLAAVVISTYFGRHVGPGLLASVLSIVVLDYFFIPPLNSFAYGLSDLLRVSVFGAVAMLIGSLNGRLKKAKDDLQSAHDVLEHRVQERTDELWQANIQLKKEVSDRYEAQKAILEISNREQQRLGQDLHDGLTQVLVGGRLVVEGVKLKLAAEQHPLSKDMEMIETCLTDALGQADGIARGLYPVELERFGLMAALEELSSNMSKVYPIACIFICQVPIQIHNPATATHLYRIAQEAVNNAIKSGKAKRIHIRLFQRAGKFFLTIADNGVGFKNAKTRNGMGLRIMEYRASMINGTLEFFSRSHGGTLVRCIF